MYGVRVAPGFEPEEHKFEWRHECAGVFSNDAKNPQSEDRSEVRREMVVGKSDKHVAVQVGVSTESSFLLPPLEAIALGRALEAEGQAILSQSVSHKDAPAA